jgi:hypothetical protein
LIDELKVLTRSRGVAHLEGVGVDPQCGRGIRVAEAAGNSSHVGAGSDEKRCTHMAQVMKPQSSSDPACRSGEPGGDDNEGGLVDIVLD